MALVLSRRKGETVHIGDNITVTVLDIVRGQVRLGFSAPKEVTILREELMAEQPKPSRNIEVLQKLKKQIREGVRG